MEVTQVTINGRAYASDCPEGLTIQDFLAKLVHNILFTPRSLRLVEIPGTNDTIDKATITSIVIATAR